MKKYYIDYREETTEIDPDGDSIYEEGSKIVEANNEEQAKRLLLESEFWDPNAVEILSCEAY